MTHSSSPLAGARGEGAGLGARGQAELGAGAGLEVHGVGEALLVGAEGPDPPRVGVRRRIFDAPASQRHPAGGPLLDVAAHARAGNDAVHLRHLSGVIDHRRIGAGDDVERGVVQAAIDEAIGPRVGQAHVERPGHHAVGGRHAEGLPHEAARTGHQERLVRQVGVGGVAWGRHQVRTVTALNEPHHANESQRERRDGAGSGRGGRHRDGGGCGTHRNSRDELASIHGGSLLETSGPPRTPRPDSTYPTGGHWSGSLRAGTTPRR